ncbi:hypothetical protein MKW94_018234 [Papaver nudicaule]|uniref:Protein FAR1-RELATED SEQUENCE n=1 Tax=Papaver nudicaule TaxID=74823 RepID=A0AA41VLY5_PAPNU|nr:hypothetical protein [Papaver nudicaule]
MGKAPDTILTDQDPWLTEAIQSQLPRTKHAFCIWHITAKFSGWFLSTLRGKYFDWCNDFYRLYRVETEEEFENEWFMTASKYNLHANKHVVGLYNARKCWVPAFLRGYFFGGMTTTGRSESINAFVKRFIDSHTTLGQFLKQVDIAIQDIQQKEAYDRMLDKHRFHNLEIISPLEDQAQKILTQYAFSMIKEQLERATQYSVLSKTGPNFVMKYFQSVTTTKKRKVYWDGNVTYCSCKNFEFCGIVCRHILQAFSHTGCFEIPDMYLPLRWRSDYLCDEDPSQIQLPTNNNDASQGETTRSVAIDSAPMDDNIGCPPMSNPKGRRKKKRMRGGKELAKQKKTCSYCNEVGHYATTCQTKKANYFFFFGNGKKKNKKKKACEDFPTAETSNNGENKKKITCDDLNLNPIFHLKY